MTFAESLCWSLVRSSAVAGAAVAMGRAMAAGIGAMKPVERRAAIALAAAPVLTPAVLIGYAYYNTSLSLIQSPIGYEVWCGVLAWLRWTPVAAAMWALAPPPPMSAMAVHTRRLAPRDAVLWQGWRCRWRFALQGRSRTAVLVFVAVFVLSFGDIEIALLLNATDWGVWLFDAYAAGVERRVALGYVAWPAAIQLAMIVGALALVAAAPGRAAASADRWATRPMRAVAWVQGMIAAAMVTVVPALWVMRGTIGGLRVLIEQWPIVREIGASLAFAAAAAAIATLAADRLARLRGAVRIVATALACMPGLVGALVLALAIVGLTQVNSTVASVVYDSPAPLLTALTLLALPVAVVMRHLIDTSRPSASLHLAALLRRSHAPPRRAWARRLRWLMHGRLIAAAVAVVFYLAYFELTASAILAPVAHTPATVRLYNFMHYGHPPALSAMMTLTTLTPLALAAAAWAGAAAWNRRALHG